MRTCLSRRRAIAATAAFGFLLAPLFACGSASALHSPEQALALSASALSGSDDYGIDGELAIYDPFGAVVNRSRFTGTVKGHGRLDIQWKGGPLQAEQTTARPGQYRPLQLLEAIRSRHAAVAYDGRPAARDGGVRLRIDIKPDTAEARVAGDLRAGLAALREEWDRKSLPPERSRQAKEILDRAERELEETLKTLTVQTRCLWQADAHTWFPTQMAEHTELTYARAGRTYREKREAVTRFLPPGRNGTIRKPATAGT